MGFEPCSYAFAPDACSHQTIAANNKDTCAICPGTRMSVSISRTPLCLHRTERRWWLDCMCNSVLPGLEDARKTRVHMLVWLNNYQIINYYAPYVGPLLKGWITFDPQRDDRRTRDSVIATFVVTRNYASRCACSDGARNFEKNSEKKTINSNCTRFPRFWITRLFLRSKLHSGGGASGFKVMIKKKLGTFLLLGRRRVYCERRANRYSRFFFSRVYLFPTRAHANSTMITNFIIILNDRMISLLFTVR